MNSPLEWWGRWDLNPGSPAPQAGILFWNSGNFPRIQENPQSLSKLDDDPAYQEYQTKVNKTLAETKANGLSENTSRSIIHTLKVLK